MKPENVAFMSRCPLYIYKLKLYARYINGKNETVLYGQ